MMDVAVFFVDLAGDRAEPGDIALLDAAEQREAARRPTRVRERYVQAHVALRRALGAALGVEPAEVTFGSPGPRGRPRLADDALSFNLSHSGQIGAIAVAARPVGIDIEVHAARSHARLARRVLHDSELDEWNAAPEPSTFYRLWTRKEAYLKALGIGIAGIRATVATPTPSGWSIVDLAAPTTRRGSASPVAASAAVAVAAAHAAISVHELS